MISFGLIIQQTNTGLDNQFVSENLNVGDQEIAQTLTDERLLATQLANRSDVYCVQTTKRFKVFSLIVTNVSDFVDRGGFFAIRVYVSKGQNVNNIHTHLLDIKERYLSFKENNNLLSQNYNAILSSILLLEDEPQEYIAIRNTADAVICIDQTSELELIFHDKKCHLFNKVYVFHKKNAADINIAIRQGMIPFEKYVSKAKEIEISDSHNILKELMINGQNVSFNRGLGNFIVLCLDKDIITYNTINGKCLKTIDGSPHSIQKDILPPTPLYDKKQTGRSKNTYGVFIVTGLMIVLLGAGISYLILQDKPSQDGSLNSTESSQTSSNETAIENNPPIQSITFIRDSTESDSVYKTNYPKLDTYRFKFEIDHWVFKTKSENNYRNFSSQTVTEVLKQNKLNFSESEKKAFVNALQSIPRHAVNDNPVLKPDIGDKSEQTNSTKAALEKKVNVRQVPAKKIKKTEPTTEEQIGNAY